MRRNHHPTPRRRTERTIARLAPILLVAALTACGDSESNASDSSGSANATLTTEPAVTSGRSTEQAPTPLASAPTTDVSPQGPVDLPAEPRVLYEWTPPGEDVKSIIVSDKTLTASPVRIVPESNGAAIHSNWSHDGSMITWEVLAGDTATVWTAEADGTEPTERVTCPGEPCVQMAWPSYSNDDRELLVTRYDLAADGDWGPSHLVLVDLASGQQTIIASTADGTTSFYVATMSPDGSQVAATLETYTDATQETRTQSEIVVVDADPITTDPPISVTDAELFAGFPDWHPTDDRILFASWNLDAYRTGDEESQLYTVVADGSALTQITAVDYETSRRRPGYARWTPDGESIIASVSQRENGELVDVKIAYIDLTTGEISESTASGAMPSLQP